MSITLCGVSHYFSHAPVPYRPCNFIALNSFKLYNYLSLSHTAAFWNSVDYYSSLLRHTYAPAVTGWGMKLTSHLHLKIRIGGMALPRLSSSQLLACHCGGPGSKPGQYVQNLWWAKWQWYSLFPSTSVFPWQYHSTNAPYTSIHL